MIDFERLDLFEEYTDEKTGVRSYILNEKPAEYVQSFYFTNQSLSDDQKYLWMYCFYPPLRHHSLGVVSLDPENPFVRVFKEAVVHAATPLVAPEGGRVYFVDGYTDAAQICTIDVNGNIELSARMDPGCIGKKAISRFGTHLSISADGRYMLVDGMFSTFGFAALVDMETREFKVINEYEGMHNHGQFSPVHPKLFLLDQDTSINPITEYHLDPHPQFTRDGRYILCTTTVRGGVDISVTPVDQLVALTQ